MARNQWLCERLPRLWFVRRAVRRFMPGEDAEAALRVATDLTPVGIASVFTRLGENLSRIEEADEVVHEYLTLIDEIGARRLDAEISFKLTQLGLDLDPERTFDHARRLAERAAVFGKIVWIDIEGSFYADATVALYERLKAVSPNAGLCLQAYLRRTAADIERLLPIGPAIRLVKGAYLEPEPIAFQTRLEVDANYLLLSVMMLAAIRDGATVRLALGTHDVRLIEQAAEQAAALGLPKRAFEIQMLYGIRNDEQRRLADEGFAVRVLVAYGASWYPWYMRRLAERPANLLFVLRQLLP